MQSSTPESEYELLALEQMAQFREEQQRKRFKGLGPESLLWLALPAAWTPQLAEACGFPTRPTGNLNDFLNEVIGRGLASVSRQMKRVGNGVETTELLLVSDLDRAQIIDSFLASHPFTYNPTEQNVGSYVQQMFTGDKGGPRDLRSVLEEVGRRMVDVGPKVQGVPPLVLLWAELAAQAGDSRRAAAYFEQSTEEAFKQRNAGRIQDWVEAARPLVALLEKDIQDPYATVLTRSIRLAQRRMELLHRRNIDNTHLDDYFRRLEQVRAFNDLMDGPDDLWALHYLGAGGAGKTMLMRDLTLYLTGDENPLAVGSNYPVTVREVKPRPEVVVARVDFDYLNADYPRIDPGQLLTELAEELQAYDPTERAVEKFRDAKARFDEVSERVDNAFLSSGGRATELREFAEGLQSYIDGLNILGRRVLLILDTCEELAKASDQGSATIDETFRILTALHDGLPGLRVVLSGRRALAVAGHRVGEKYSWKLSPCDLPARAFLRLHEMRGFEHEEVAYFLKFEEIEDRYIDAIWKASCPDIHVVYNIDWQGEQAQAQPEAIDRCNPYKMSQFKEWVRDSAPPSPEEIAQATPTTYVKVRIIDRLSKDHIDSALLAAAVLGHFNQSTLAAACNSNQETISQAFARLSEQEWISHTYEPEAEEEDRLVLHTERGVRDGLLAYYTQNQEDQVAAVRHRAGAYLRAKIKDTPLDHLSWPLIDAALSASQGDLAEAASWWRSLEMHLFMARDSKWVMDTIDPILGKDGSVFLRDSSQPPEAPPENKLRPLVLATQAAAQLQLNDTRDLPRLWREVSEKSEGVEALAQVWLRAEFGQVAAAGYNRMPVTEEMAERFWGVAVPAWNRVNDPELAAGVIAALEALVEEAERKKGEGGADLARQLVNTPHLIPNKQDVFGLAEQVVALLDRSEDEDSQDLCGFTWMLAARAVILGGDVARARLAFERSIKAAARERRSPVRRWLDWSPPVELRTRLRLELARVGCPAAFFPSAALTLLRPWGDEITDQKTPNTDIDRFWAEMVRLQLALGSIPEGVPSSVVEADTGAFIERSLSGGGATLPNAYRLVPPLFIVEANVFAFQGKVEDALSRLKQVTLQTQVYETRDIQHAERGLLRLIRRFRLAEEGETSGAQLASSTIPADRELLRHPFVQRPKTILEASHNRIMAVSSLLSGDDFPDEEEEWQNLFLAGEKLPESFFVKWKNRYQELVKKGLAQRQLSFADISLILPLTELYHLAQENSQVDVFEWEEYSELLDLLSPVEWHEQHPAEPEGSLRLGLRYTTMAGARPLGELFSPAPSSIGGRRAGEIALDEADLLILRLPAQAAHLYKRAAEWYEASGSLPESLIAWMGVGLSQLLSGTPGSKVEGVTDTLAAVKRSYRAIQVAGVVKLPAYTELVTLAKNPSREGLEGLRPAGWRPWLVRLVYLLNRTIATEGNANMVGWREWLAAHDAPLEMGRVVELDEAQASVEEGKAAVPEPSPGPTRWWLRAILYLLGGAAGLVVLLLLIALIRSSFTWLTPLSISPETSWLKGLNVSVGSLVTFIICAIGLGSASLAEDSAKKPKAGEKAGETKTSCWITAISWVFGIAGFLSVLGILGGIVWALYIAMETSAFMGNISGFLRWSIALAFFFAGAGILYWLFTVPGRIRSWLASRSYLIGTIASQGSGVFSSQNVEENDRGLVQWNWIKISRRFSPFHFPPVFQKRTVYNLTVPLDLARNNQEYTNLTALLSDEFIAELKTTHKALRGQSMQVALEPLDGIHEPCWEAGLVYPLLSIPPGTDYKKAVPFCFTRQTSTNIAHLSTGDAGEIRPPDFRSWRLPNSKEKLQVFTWLSKEDGTFAQIASSAWKKNKRSEWRSFDGGKYDDPNCLVHLVGKVDSRRGTVSLRIESGSGTRKSASADYVTAIDVRRSFPRLSLCIVQGSPQVEVGERLPSDRREAGLGRVLCSELATQGVPVVIYLPMMDQKIGQQALDTIASFCKPGARLAQIQTGLRTVQQMIVKYGAGSADAWECALDVCLYVSSNDQVRREVRRDPMAKSAA